MQEIRRALRVGCGSQDRPLVVTQDLGPRRNIGSVIRPHFRRQVEVGAKEGRTKLGDKLRSPCAARWWRHGYSLLYSGLMFPARIALPHLSASAAM